MGDKAGAGKSGNSRQRSVTRSLAAKAAPKDDLIREVDPTLPTTEPVQSNLGAFLDWEGVSFVFLAGTALGLLALDEYDAARWFFVAGAMAGAIKLVKIIEVRHRYQKALVAVVSSLVAAIGVNHVNDWATARQIAANDKREGGYVLIIREQKEAPRKRGGLSTEPSDRANLHVVSVRVEAWAPSEQFNKNVATFPSSFALFAYSLPTPQAFISVKNVGRFRALAPFALRTAMIISPPLAPGDEETLFKQRPEWQSGGMFSMGNDWYPGEIKEVRGVFSNGLLKPTDWPDLLAGKQVLYVVTKNIYKDKLGMLPVAESCTVISMVADTTSLCFGHNN